MPDFGLGMFVPHQRSIGGIIADVTVEEQERDDVTSTEHPVEQGAPVGDHAFKRPEEVTIRAGWNEALSGDLSAESGVYGIILNWQASFVLFDLYTAKRRHKNMLLSSVISITDEHSAYSLMLQLSCKEMILTKTQTAQTGISGNASDHTDPTATAPQVDLGPQSSGTPNASQSDKVLGDFNSIREDTGESAVSVA
jgi:hypothetical protein